MVQPLPRHREPPQEPFGPTGFAFGGAGILLVAIGQYCWSAGRHPLGGGLVTVGGLLVAFVLARAAWIGLPGRRKS